MQAETRSPTSLRRRVLMVGSLNIDLVVQVERLPRPGETVTGGHFFSACGGKGANQAVAAARFGADVRMVGCVGPDEYGRRLRMSLEADGVGTSWLRCADSPTGVATILVDGQGENCIAVATGANKEVQEADLADERIAWADALVAQLEVPLETVAYGLERAHGLGVQTILNAAPATSLPHDVLENVDVLIVNEHELATLLGRDIVRDGQEAEALAALGLRRDQVAIVTLGARGALLRMGDFSVYQPALPVTTVDTTAAGDAFVGTLVAAGPTSDRLQEVLRLACAAGALATTRKGAQPSLPNRDAVQQFLAGGLHKGHPTDSGVSGPSAHRPPGRAGLGAP